MTEEKTSYKVLKKDKAIKVTIGGHEIVALNLPGIQVLELGGTVTTFPVGVGIAGKKGVENNWIAIVKDPKGIVKPYHIWAKDVATAISEASGNDVSNLSIAVSPPDYETLIVDSEEDLKKAYAENWSEPYQYEEGKWILRKPK